jgi:hypothetical protein
MLEPAVDNGIQPVGIDHLMHIADAMRLLRRKALAREKVAVRGPGTHGADHIGADGGGNQADLDLAEAKPAVSAATAISQQATRPMPPA